MDSRKLVLKETAVVAIGQIICIAIMLGVFALLGKFDQTVLWGGIMGGVLAIANFFFMAIGANLAADKAEADNVKGGKATIQVSFLIRQAALVILLYAGAKSGFCNIFSLLLLVTTYFLLKDIFVKKLLTNYVLLYQAYPNNLNLLFL